jgi:hypothetical protein
VCAYVAKIWTRPVRREDFREGATRRAGKGAGLAFWKFQAKKDRTPKLQRPVKTEIKL